MFRGFLLSQNSSETYANRKDLISKQSHAQNSLFDELLCWNVGFKQAFTLEVKDWHWMSYYFFETSTELCGWWVESGKKRSKLSWEDSIIVERTQLEQTPFNEDGAVSETLVEGWKQRCVIIKVIRSSEQLSDRGLQNQLKLERVWFELWPGVESGASISRFQDFESDFGVSAPSLMHF